MGSTIDTKKKRKSTQLRFQVHPTKETLKLIQKRSLGLYGANGFVVERDLIRYYELIDAQGDVLTEVFTTSEVKELVKIVRTYFKVWRRMPLTSIKALIQTTELSELTKENLLGLNQVSLLAVLDRLETEALGEKHR